MHETRDGDCDNQRTGDGGAAVSIRLVGVDRPLFLAIAFSFSVAALLYAWMIDNDLTRKSVESEREARMAQYQVDQLKEWNVEHGLGLPPALRQAKPEK